MTKSLYQRVVGHLGSDATGGRVRGARDIDIEVARHRTRAGVHPPQRPAVPLRIH